MASKSGTNVASAVTTFSDADTYATAYANEIQGGRHSAATLADRNAIPIPRRQVGMTCYVEATKVTYKLANNPATVATQDTDWELDIPSADDIKLTDGTTLNSKVTDLETAVAERYVMFCLTPLNVGIDDKEQVMPIKANIVSITANVPVGTVLTKDVVANIESYNGTWSVVDSITIVSSDPSKSATKTLSVPQNIAIGNRLRVNVISAQSGIESLIIAVGLQLTK